jgi:asparagine synthase (glutamine-hydrolysing)
LPEEILHRKKQGFVGPDLFYMNIEWYKSILKDSSLIRDGLIRKEYYTNLVAKKDHWRLWKLVVIEKWYQRWIV